MIVSTRRCSRRLATALVGLGALAVLAGCADSPGGTASAPTSSAPASTGSSSGGDGAESTAPTPTEDLTAALLPAEAFGPDATVVTVSVEQLSSASTGLPAGASITPETCAQDVGGTQLSVEDFGSIVAQTATTPVGVTVQVLAESDQLDGTTPRFDELLARCPQVTVTAPDGSTATIDFTALDVPALGDTSEGVTYTTAVRGTDGTNLTVPTLLAVATDGNRMLYLQQTGTNTAPLDQAAFTTLLEKAFDTQQAN